MGEFIGKGCWVILLLILIYNRIKFFIFIIEINNNCEEKLENFFENSINENE